MNIAPNTPIKKYDNGDNVGAGGDSQDNKLRSKSKTLAGDEGGLNSNT
jgi:hypothetical protein